MSTKKIPNPLRLAGAFLLLLVSGLPAVARMPNVLVILTDDHGYGELGATGNPVVRTPQMDRLAAQSASLTQFNVMPVCSPTRAAFLTGRNYYRTGLTDTWMGRSLIDPAERTLAEILRDAGYHTGIFGKWHLGDNYPRRAMDQGFEESLVLNGGGLAQPGDPPDPVDERGAYFNATMSHNGSWIKTDGYVADVITTAAIRFMERERDRPFFVYLPFNTPHSPHQVPDEYRQHYPPEMFDPARYPGGGWPMSPPRRPGDLARVYGMVENIDDNVGRVLAKLDELGLAEDTIVVLFSDNGCQQHGGFNAGLRDWKGSPYEGGIHQFCYLRWPRPLAGRPAIDRVSAVFDLAPTLLDLCGVKRPAEVAFDGRSLAPLLRGQAGEWPDRAIVAQWHRGDVPGRYRSFALRTQEWKLVQPLGRGDQWDGRTDFQLYHLSLDPCELHNVAGQYPQRVAELKAAYDRWFDDVVGHRDFTEPQRIYIGTPYEDPVLLTRQDWRGPAASWRPDGHGYWEVNIARAARYDIRLRFDAKPTAGTASFAVAGVAREQPIRAGDDQCVFRAVPLPAGPGRFEAAVQQGPGVRGVEYVEVSRSEGAATSTPARAGEAAGPGR